MKPHEYVILEIAQEREKQVAKWGNANDDRHDHGELALAAMWLALPALSSSAVSAAGDLVNHIPEWATTLAFRHGSNRRRELVIAAALIVAEIERLDRAEAGRG
jgi:hypothetical protein